MIQLLKDYLDANKSYPLLLPEGSVRAILALALLAITADMFFHSIPIPNWFEIVVASGINTYFLTRPSKTLAPET